MGASFPGETELAFAGIRQLARLLEQGALSSTELTEVLLSRQDRLGSHYNALANATAERARREARRSDAARRQRGAARGPLDGIPYGAKDLLAARGAPTTWGAPPFREQVFAHDATVVQRLQRSGAVLAGKLAMVELAGGGGYRYANASLQGPGRNPWNPEHWSGGSSSGSGAAVAAGIVPYAIGSETSGSIITPAAYCGVTGLRPTYGLVSRHGAMALSWTLDKLGPLARSAEDCGLVLEAIAGSDRRDPTSAGRRFTYAPLDVASLRSLTLGYAPADFEDFAAEATRPIFAHALQALRTLGANMRETALPSDLPYGPVTSTVINVEGATAFAALIESDRFEELVDAKQKAGLRAALSISARDYVQAMRIRRLVQNAFRDLFHHVDVLVSVGRNVPATRIDEPLDGARPAETSQPSNAGLVPAGNLAGLPALCLPCGFTPEGLPLSLQFVGPPFSENTLLSLGAWFQAQTDWHRKRPPGTE
jgi:aspartyl-tRNA(Asn)/glutamyl-tRNA(Gln) amidotransferase subunit A